MSQVIFLALLYVLGCVIRDFLHSVRESDDSIINFSDTPQDSTPDDAVNDYSGLDKATFKNEYKGV